MVAALMRTKFKLLRNQKGMTLIELLAVVVVLGIISAIAVPAIAGTIKNTKTSADAASQKVIAEAAYRYFLDTDPEGKSATTGTESVTVDTLKTSGYLSEGFSVTTQANSAQKFTNVTGTYTAGTGWKVADTDVTIA